MILGMCWAGLYYLPFFIKNVRRISRRRLERMTEEIPGEFTDEEKWLKFFPKEAFIALGIGVGITLLMANFFKIIMASLFLPILIINGAITAVIVALIMVHRADTEWLTGGGQSYASIIIKKIIRRANRCIYVLGYGRY